ncbi:MAG: gamma carbonic anhydrase family protein [Dehalococcoidia bacterium]
MIEIYDGIAPRISQKAFVHPMAIIRGDVEIDDYSIVWPMATITGDICTIKMGRYVTIEDHASIHGGTFEDWQRGQRGVLEIGDRVTIGHGAIVHGRKIGDRALIGMGATVLQDVEIENGCIVAAGAVVSVGTKIPAGSVVAGIPAQVKGQIRKEQAYWVGEGLEEDDSYYRECIRKLKEARVVE